MSYNPIDPADSLSISVVVLNDALDALARDFQGETAPASPSSFQRWIKPSTFVGHFRNVSNSTWVPWQSVNIPSGFYFSDGTDHILIRAPADVAASGYTLVLPAAQGSNNQYLKNDGAGNLEWTTLGAGVSALDDLSDVTLTAPAAGHLIRHNGTVFVNQLGLAIGDLTVASAANGDLIYRTGGVFARLPIGTNNQVLTVVSGAPAWAAGGGGAAALDDLTDVTISAPASGHLIRHNGTVFVNQLGLAIGDLTVASATRGDLIVRGTSAFVRLALGTSGQVLTSNGTDPVWQDPTGGGAIALDDLTDVTISAPAAGHYTRYGGSGWLNSALLVTDLSIAAAATGDLVYYNGTTFTRFPRGSTGQFLRATGSTIAFETVALGATLLDELSDVTISGSPTTGQLIRFTGTTWQNTQLLPTELSAAGTARGALIRRGASAWETVALGTNTQVLTSNGTDAVWAAPSAGSLDALTDVTISSPAAGHLIRHNGTLFVNQLGLAIGDLTVASAARGDLIVRGTSAFVRLALGTSGQVLTSDGTDAGWADPPGGGGGNAFQTINVPTGTDPVADSATDTLNLATGSGVEIVGDSSTDTITFSLALEEIDHDALLNYNANKHPDRTGTVSVTGAWSFDRSSGSEVFLEIANPGANVHSLRVDGDLAVLRGASTGRLTSGALAANRTWTFPDSTGEVTLGGNTFTGTGSMVRATGPTVSSLLVNTSITLAAGGAFAFVATGGDLSFDIVNTLTQSTIVTIPDPGTTGTTLLFSHGAEFDESPLLKAGVELAFFRDSNTHFLGTVGSLTAARTWDLPNVSGEITVGGNAFTGTGAIAREASPTFSGTLSATSIFANSVQGQALVIKELIGTNTLALTLAATAADYVLTFPAASALPPSGTYFLKVDSSGNISYVS